MIRHQRSLPDLWQWKAEWRMPPETAGYQAHSEAIPCSVDSHY